MEPSRIAGIGSFRSQTRPRPNQHEVLTDSSIVGSSQSLGTYADQLGNFAVVSGGISFETDATYNYVRSAGIIKGVLPMGSNKDGGTSPLPSVVPYSFRLASGDQLMVMANPITSREASLSVACQTGNTMFLQSPRQVRVTSMNLFRS